MIKICITFYHVLSLLITPYPLAWKENRFMLATLKISSQAPGVLSHLIKSCHPLITPYPLGWKENHFMLATLRLVPRLHIFYHILLCLVTPYHTLCTRLERKPFYVGNFKISSQAPDVLSHLITSCHSLSHLITPCHSLSHLIP